MLANLPGELPIRNIWVAPQIGAHQGDRQRMSPQAFHDCQRRFPLRIEWRVVVCLQRVVPVPRRKILGIVCFPRVGSITEQQVERLGRWQDVERNRVDPAQVTWLRSTGHQQVDFFKRREQVAVLSRDNRRGVFIQIVEQQQCLFSQRQTVECVFGLAVLLLLGQRCGDLRVQVAPGDPHQRRLHVGERRGRGEIDLELPSQVFAAEQVRILAGHRAFADPSHSVHRAHADHFVPAQRVAEGGQFFSPPHKVRIAAANIARHPGQDPPMFHPR